MTLISLFFLVLVLVLGIVYGASPRQLRLKFHNLNPNGNLSINSVEIRDHWRLTEKLNYQPSERNNHVDTDINGLKRLVSVKLHMSNGEQISAEIPPSDSHLTVVPGTNLMLVTMYYWAGAVESPTDSRAIEEN
jgi:hypothetical protein